MQLLLHFAHRPARFRIAWLVVWTWAMVSIAPAQTTNDQTGGDQTGGDQTGGDQTNDLSVPARPVAMPTIVDPLPINDTGNYPIPGDMPQSAPDDPFREPIYGNQDPADTLDRNDTLLPSAAVTGPLPTDQQTAVTGQLPTDQQTAITGQLPTDQQTAVTGQLDNLPSSDPATTAAIAGQNQAASRAREVRAATPVLFPDRDDRPDPRANLPAPQVEPGTRPSPRTDPFAALGITRGSFTLFPVIEQSVGYNTNTAGIRSGEGSFISQTDGSLAIRSNWSRHALDIDLAAGYYLPLGNGTISGAEIPTASANGDFRFDLRDGYQVHLRGAYGYTTEAFSSSNLPLGAAERPGVHTYGGNLEVLRSGRQLDLALRGAIIRNEYETALLTDNTRFDQNDRNNNDFGLTARVLYHAPGLVDPFVEGGYGWTVFDQRVDRNGEQRDSRTWALRAGIAVNRGDKLNGELSVGYLRETFDDTGLAAIGAVVVDGRLNWSPERDTVLALSATTNVSGSTSAGESGSVTYGAAANLTRRVRDNLALSAGLGFGYQDYVGSARTDLEYTVTAAARYWFSRYMSASAGVSYFLQDSNEDSQTYDAAQFTLGLRLQR